MDVSGGSEEEGGRRLLILGSSTRLFVSSRTSDLHTVAVVKPHSRIRRFATHLGILYVPNLPGRRGRASSPSHRKVKRDDERTTRLQICTSYPARFHLQRFREGEREGTVGGRQRKGRD